MMTSLMNFINYISEKEIRVSMYASKPYSDESKILRVVITDTRYFNHLTKVLVLDKTAEEQAIIAEIESVVNDILKGREQHEAHNLIDRN